MINGTKLLNVAGMTRGRRDGILKSEKLRHVVKIGPMHLKGVWYVFSSHTAYAASVPNSFTLQDPIRACSGICQQGEDHRSLVPTVCA